MSKPDRGQRIPELEKLLGKVMPSKRKRKAKRLKKFRTTAVSNPQTMTVPVAFVTML